MLSINYLSGITAALLFSFVYSLDIMTAGDYLLFFSLNTLVVSDLWTKSDVLFV
jgi:hypothetical protein